MIKVEEEITAMVDAETAAWNARDAEALVSLFHPDAVWPWPPNADAHDPMTWVLPFGRFNEERWKRSWQELFETHDLVHNDRKTLRVVVSEQGDGAFAVVDASFVDVNLSNVRCALAHRPSPGLIGQVKLRPTAQSTIRSQSGARVMVGAPLP
jgi:ketosteroid isomerase-like protein